MHGIATSSYNAIYGVYPIKTIYTNYPPTNEITIEQVAINLNKTIYYSSEPLPQNTITLTSQSGTKFTFYDKDQLQVTFTGEWTPADFTFFVERYIDNEWQQFSDSNDYYELYGYENPYYIFWRNLNYYPAGTYRYSALYGNNPEQAYYSSSFEIYDTVIENNATGNVDSNGNIDINIDTGKTVDSIIDYLGQETDITKNQFTDNFPEVDVEDPTSDFFTWFFTQIQSCFTVNTAQYLTFTLYGETFTINSDDYILNLPIANTVLGVGSSIFLLYGIFLDIRKEIEKVKEGKFSEIGKDDISASMM